YPGTGGGSRKNRTAAARKGAGGRSGLAVSPPRHGKMPSARDEGRRSFAAFRGGSVMAKKTTCPISRKDFRANAKPVTVRIGEIPLQAEVKEFSTGSLGWYLNGKTMIEINGTAVSVQIGLNLTIVGSKELPKDGDTEAA